MSYRNTLTAEQLLYGYASGVFPMAEGKRGRIYWYAPDPRAIIPIATYKPQKSLRPIINQKKFDIRFDTSFEQVMRHCAAPRTDDHNTWISEEIMGLIHSCTEWAMLIVWKLLKMESCRRLIWRGSWRGFLW
jgi:Leu/Phe-tRNA-protein transferase